MSIDFQSLLQPVSTDHPGGEDCRLGANFTAISAEVDKLTRAKDVGEPDWVKIETLATQVLTQQSKDFLIAGWISAAWLEKEGLSGMSAGLGLFNGLFSEFWDTAFPPLARLRGRRNAISWWLDRALSYLTTASIPALTQEVFDDLLSKANALDKNLADKDPDAPSLGDFLRAINNLTVLAPTPPPPSPSPVVSTDGDVAQAPDNTQNNAVANPAPAAAAVTNNSAATPSLNMKSVQSINTIEDVQSALSTVQPYINDVAQALSKLDPYNPLSIHLTRFAARDGIVALPPATAGATLIPEPPPSEIEMLQSVSSGTNPQATIEFCEARISEYPFWFDLDYFSAQAYGSLGAPAAGMREAVIDDILAFVKRLPGVEALTFGGQKTPFASPAAQSWLTDCENERSGGATDNLSLAKKTAMESLGAGQFEAALGVFQSFINQTRVGRDQFRARLQLVEMALGVKKEADLVSFVNPLIQECLARKIAEWEPDMALAAWNLKLQVLHQAIKASDPNVAGEKISKYQDEVEEALQQISTLSFVDAARSLA